MKINRIDVLKHYNQNKHKQFLNNDIMPLMKGFGGEFRRESIKLSAMPEYLLEKLEELKIKFELLNSKQYYGSLKERRKPL